MSSTLKVPLINNNDDRVEIVRWHVENRSLVEKGQELVDLGTSKAVITVESEHSGYVLHHVPQKKLAKVGSPLASFFATLAELAAGEKAQAPAAAPAAVAKTSSASKQAPGRASLAKKPTAAIEKFPFTRFSAGATRLIEERGLSPKDFDGMGLVTESIVERVLGGGSESGETPIAADPVSLEFVKRSEPVSLLKIAEIQALTQGLGGGLTSSLTTDFKSAPIRARLLRDGALEGQVLPLILFEASRLIHANPKFTAFFHGDEIHYYDRVDGGVAIDLGEGLKVVTLRNLDRMLPAEIFESLVNMAVRYTNNELKLEDLTGSTFTVTDLSGFNVRQFEPLVNGKQSVIFGIGGDATAPGHPMTITLAFDHRVLTGREVGLFLSALRERLLTYGQGAVESNAPFEAPSDEIACSRCFTDVQSYYAKFGRSGFMQLYINPEGKLAYVCHACVYAS